jgi:hypothetical protein
MAESKHGTIQNRTNINEGETKVEMTEFESPLFRQSCRDCDFCDGLRDEGKDEKDSFDKPTISAKGAHNVKIYHLYKY